jgi:hypothetical protein
VTSTCATIRVNASPTAVRSSVPFEQQVLG